MPPLRKSRGWFFCAVVAAVCLSCSTYVAVATDADAETGDVVGSSSSSSSSASTADDMPVGAITPQEAYEKALHLLRTTLVHPPRPAHPGGEGARGSMRNSQTGQAAQQASRGRGKGARKLSGASERRPQEPVSGISLYWELVRAWLPFSGIYRDLFRLRDAIAELNPFPLNDNAPDQGGGPFGSRFGSSLRSASKSTWEGASLLATPDGYGGGNDPAEEEQARLYPNARPEQLWPEWDGADDAYFGPFWATTHSDSLDDVLGQAAGLPFLGANATVPWEKMSLPGTAGKKRKAEEQRLSADHRREEAIALLTWAGGWTNANVVFDAQNLLQSASSVDWSREAVRGASSNAYTQKDAIDVYLASANKTLDTPGRPLPDALWALGQHSFWGTHGTIPNPARAKACFERLAALNGNASAHNILGWLEGGAWGSEGWHLLGAKNVSYAREDENENRQAKALMHYYAAARQGDTLAQTTLGYRHHTGIAVKESCGATLYWYEKAAADSVQRFQSGPPGGLTLPYTHMRLSDISGGVFGPGSSAASTGLAKFRPAIQAMMHSLPAGGSTDGQRLEDLLEFFVYHAQRGSPGFALKLARIYYGGSVLGTSESAARVRRDFRKAREYLLKITAEVWPTDTAVVRRGGPSGAAAKAGQRGEDLKLKVDDVLGVQAGLAAGLMGRMWLRGEGVHRDYARAWVWFSRGAEQGDLESYNGLGVMYQHGLGVPRDIKKATEYFEASASLGAMASPEGCVNLGKIYLAMEEYTHAVKYFDLAMKLGNSFEAFYYLAKINVRMANFQVEGDAYRVGPQGTASYERCRNAVNGFKYAVERADWKDPTFGRAERAWSKGLRGRALLGWSLAGERGYEAAQNNVAWVLDRDKKRLRIDQLDATQSNATDRLALIHWIRSAAQDNVDALVKMGDYYYYGLGVGEQSPASHWNDPPASATSSLPRPAPSASYDKAAACYSAAAERQTSALAYWNMGFMYERGLGVPKKDYNLAKRFYDMALELNPSEAYLPVFLSVAKLFAMAVWDAVRNKDASALSLLNGVAFGSAGRARVLNAMGGGYFDNGDLPYTEGDEIRLQQERDKLAATQGAAGADVAAGGDADIGDMNLPETYEYGLGGAGGGAGQRPQREGATAAGAAATGERAPVGTEDLDDTIEGLMIIIGLAALAMLVYARQGIQMRVERHRREAQRQQQDENANANANVAADQNPRPALAAGAPPDVDPNQPFGWPLQDGNAYAGL